MNSKTLDALIELKRSGIKEIHFKSIGGQDFLFRPLTFLEHNTVTDLEEHISTPDVNDLIVKMCTLYPSSEDVEEWLDECPAKDPDILVDNIIEASGFNSSESMLESLREARNNAGNITALMQIYICRVFPSLKPHDVDNMTLKEQLDLFAKAESLIGNQIDIEDVLKNDIEGSGPPVPPGMESTEGDFPNLDNVFKGIPEY